jgi:hypothetical protein
MPKNYALGSFDVMQLKQLKVCNYITKEINLHFLKLLLKEISTNATNKYVNK